MREANARVVELDHALADGRLERLAATRSRSPCAAATSSTVGRASAATWSRTSTVSAGSRARRPPSSSRRLSGTRSAWPGAGRVFVRTSSRPSSSAKNGLPAVASCTRASSGRVSSSPSRSSSRRWSAPRLSGPSESRSSRSSGKERSSSSGAADLGRLPQRRQQADRLLAQAPQRDLQHAGRGRVEPLHVVERDEHRAVARPAARSTSSTASPIACGSGAASPGSASSSATSSARRRGGASEGATSSSTGASSSESPAKESDASASTPRQVRTRPKRSRPPRRPPPRGSSCRSRPRRRARARRGPCSTSARERLDRAELLVAPDDLRGHAHLSPRPPCPATAQVVLPELGAADAELAVDVREVRLDRAHAHEELGGDLLVGAALGRELGDPPLGLGQLVGGRRAAADPPELRPRLLRPQPRAQLLEDRERLLERLAGGPLLLRLPAHRRPGRAACGRARAGRAAVQLGEGALEGRERAGEVALGGGEQAAAARGRGDGPRAPEPRARVARTARGRRAPARARRGRPASRSRPPRRRRRVVRSPTRAAVRGGRAGSSPAASRLPSASSRRPSTPRLTMHEDLVRHRLRGRESLPRPMRAPRRRGRGRPRSSALIAAHPDARVCVLGLLGDLVRGGGVVERPLPAAGEPLEQAQPPEDLTPRASSPRAAASASSSSRMARARSISPERTRSRPSATRGLS